MAIPPGKTPISYLQEYCTKRGLTPEYTLLSHEGAVHEPTFVMKVTVGEASADGKSTSKKKAKHCAAKAVLGTLLGLQNGVVSENEGTNVDETGDTKEELKGVGNSVGELQEFTQKRMIKPALYTFDNDKRLPHERLFFCTVKLGKMEEKGEGKSKRAAKRDAAAAMMAHIRKLVLANGGDPNLLLVSPKKEDGDAEEGEEAGEKGFPVTKGKKSKSKEPVDLDLLTPQRSIELQLFYETVMQSAGKTLKSASVPAPATNYCQMLQEIADTQRFEVTMYEVQDRTTQGYFQTILKLTMTPVTVCHGCGSTLEDSRSSAAHNALQYLRILIKP